MTVLADALVARESITIRELIGNRVMNVLPEAGRWFDDMEMIDVGTASGYEVGRDMLVKRRYMGSIAGTVVGGQNFNNRAIYGDKTTALNNSPFYLHALQMTGPSPLTSPVPKAWGWTGELYSGECTVPLTIGQLRLEATPANIKDQIAPVFEGMAKNIAHFVSCHFFTDREQNNRLATLGGTGAGATQWAYDNTNKTLTFFPLERTIHRFVPGQEVDLWDTSGAARINESGGARIPMWIMSVSHTQNRVKVQIDPAQDLTAAPWTTLLDNTTESIALGDAITWHSQNSGQGLKAPYGWHDWIKAGSAAGTSAKKRLLGSAAITTTTDDYIDVEDKPFAQSYQRESIGVLNQQDLELYVDEANLALSAYGGSIDCLLFSRGVRHAMWQLDLARSYLTNNRPANQSGNEQYGLKGGFKISTPSGGTIDAYVSPMVEDGECLGLKLKGNWKILTLPNPQGSGSNSQLSPNSSPARSIPIVFKGKLFGFPTDKVPIYNANAENLDGVHFPASFTYQMIPQEQIPGLRLTGISTSRAFSTPA
jgi:hypothetical protein